MHISVSSTALLASLAHILTASAQDACPGALTPSYAQPVFADGWTGSLVAKGLTRPRGMQLDSQGNLLVVQQGVGIVHLQFTDGGGTCLTLAKKTTLITDSVVSIVVILMEKLCLCLFRRAFFWSLVYYFTLDFFIFYFWCFIFDLYITWDRADYIE